VLPAAIETQLEATIAELLVAEPLGAAALVAEPLVAAPLEPLDADAELAAVSLAPLTEEDEPDDRSWTSKAESAPELPPFTAVLLR